MTSATETVRRVRRHLMPFLITFAAMFAACAAWAIALPPGASPDEPDHFIRAAAVARGQVLGEEGAQPWLRDVQVPAGIANSRAWLCYSGDSYVDASCMPDLPPDSTEVTAYTSAGLYNPVYYAMVGLPTLWTNDAETALYGARLLSAAWCCLLLAAGFTFVHVLFGRRWAGLVTIAVATPMVVFLAATINPNGVEIAATFAAMTGCLYLARRGGNAPWWALVPLTVAVMLVATVRGLGLLFLALVAATALASASRERVMELLRSRRVQVALALMLAVSLWAAWWTLSTGTLGAMGKFPGAGETSPLAAFMVIVSRTIAPGLVGHFAWHDVLAPSFTYFAYSLIMGVLVLIALAVGSRRALVPVGVAGVGWLLIPPTVQAISITNSGYIWQARYAIPALTTLVVLAAFVVIDHLAGSERLRSIAQRGIFILCTLGLIAHLGAMEQVQRRFGVSMTGSLDGAYTGPNWSPPAGALAWIVLLATALTAWLAWSLRGDANKREV